MRQKKVDWHPAGKLAFWTAVGCWVLFVMTIFGSPQGIAGTLIDWVQAVLSPKQMTLITNTFAITGAYTITRLIIGIRTGMKALETELLAVSLVALFALTGGALMGARCDIYIYCAEELTGNQDCERDWDRQGAHCK